MRVKRTDETFTSGDAYLEAAKAFREGKVDADRLGSGAQLGLNLPSPTSIDGINSHSTSEPADDFLGLAKSAMRSTEGSSSDSRLSLQATEQPLWISFDEYNHCDGDAVTCGVRHVVAVMSRAKSVQPLARRNGSMIRTQ